MLSILLAAVAATAAPPPPYPDVAAVQRIEIRATGGLGLGINRLSITVIERKNGQLSYYGMNPSPWIVSALLSALNGPTKPAPDAAMFGFSNIESTGEFAHSCVGDAADLPAVGKRYGTLFADQANQQQWLHDYYVARAYWHTDDYPTETVKITLTDGSTISAESESQTEYMLPFSVTIAGQTAKTFDPKVAEAIAALSPGDVNYDRLTGRRFFDRYGDSICGTYGTLLDALVIQNAAPAISDYVRRNRIEIGRFDLSLSKDLGQLSGEIRFPEWPAGLTFWVLARGSPLDMAATQAAGLQALRSARVEGARIAGIEWLSHWFRTAKGASLFLMPLSGGNANFSRDEILDELERHAPDVYGAVRADEDKVLGGMMWDKHSNMASSWLFLPDGRSVLVEFNSTQSTLGPLERSSVVSWSSFARDEGDAKYPWRATVTVLDQRGRVIKP